MHSVPRRSDHDISTHRLVRDVHAPRRPYRVAVLAAGLVFAAACSSNSPASEGPHTVPRRVTPESVTGEITSATASIAIAVPDSAFPGEGISGGAADKLQQSVDAGHQPWRLDEDSVVRSFVSGRFGWSQATITYGRHDVAFVTGPDGRRVALRLAQPARRDNGGIWVVESGNRL
ncbi:acyl transferase [Nocardia spumae]|uniref:acyl transferase n=1 Tax=Nocardia spumae TaxID=2887190 RepID=UPI001D13E70E|nr:acyl transferase [Nocardia spumae]